ncbi:hypothetical protein [Thermoactinospora rubra]|uniref:hypothetical protein n=1 Tax=Thermoactinospora rubra TaxID=1088767 RepID=UPI000A121847|nr:hypothetical protein [Thermoactinospora rubra]
MLELEPVEADLARDQLEESVRLRRELGFTAGAAANLAASAHIRGDREEALRLPDEATGLAESSGAQGVSRWVEQARGMPTGEGCAV